MVKEEKNKEKINKERERRKEKKNEEKEEEMRTSFVKKLPYPSTTSKQLPRMTPKANSLYLRKFWNNYILYIFYRSLD